MSADVVIRAEGLGKQYRIGHAQGAPYTALRDVVAESVRAAGRNLASLVRGGKAAATPQAEDFWALRNVNFEIRRGDVVGIIGRNGAGKSTLLKVLSRITEPTEGRLIARGRIASLLEVGTGFHPELTGRENIYLNGAILGMTRAEIRRKFDAIVAFAEVEKFLDTPVKRYSSGMYVRLAFSVAAHLESEILVIDEVLAVGDAEFQKKCLGKMQDVAGDGRTVLFVSHNMAAVGALCGRGLVLVRGRVDFDGNAAAALARYASSQRALCEVAFAPDPARPSIVGVSVNTERLKTGELEVRIGFASPHALKTPTGGVVLRAPTGEVIWGSNGRFHPSRAPANALTRGTLVCECRDLPVVGEEYLLSAWLGDWAEDHDRKLDVLSLALGAPGAPQRPPSSVVGYLDWPAQWRADPP